MTDEPTPPPAADGPLPLLPGDLVDWERRLARERPGLERLVAAAPSKRVLDLGCGSGQHARLLAELGCEVVAIDASSAALERAQDEAVPDGVRFVLGEIGAVEGNVHGQFGAAFCLGNTAAHLLTPESLSRMLVGLRRRLQPGAPLVLQLFNYDSIFAHPERSLPVLRFPVADGDRVVVRLVDPRPDGIVLHADSVLRYRPATHPPVELVDTRSHQLRGWRRAELETLLDVARWPVRELLGDLAGSPYDPQTSAELVVVAG